MMPLLLLMLGASGAACGPRRSVPAPHATTASSPTHKSNPSSPFGILTAGWSGSQRTALEVSMTRGLTVAHFASTTSHPLSHCWAPGHYRYVPRDFREYHLDLFTEQDLVMHFRTPSQELRSALQQAGRLNVDVVFVGTYEASTDALSRDALQGECVNASHLLRLVDVGAFVVTTENGTVISRDGDLSRCKLFQAGAPPEGCSAAIAFAAVPIGPQTRPSTPVVRVPGGALRTSNAPIPVSSFFIDATETTVEEYEACVKATACTPPDTGDGCNWGIPQRAHHPVNCVDAYQALDYCQWLGKALPSPHELAFAAVGESEVTYPWGAAPPEDQTCWGKPARESTCTVGSFPKGDSPFGAKDLAGNVREWASRLPTIPRGSHIKRVPVSACGGSWKDTDPKAFGLRNLDDSCPSIPHTARDNQTGFRCLQR